MKEKDASIFFRIAIIILSIFLVASVAKISTAYVSHVKHEKISSLEKNAILIINLCTQGNKTEKDFKSCVAKSVNFASDYTNQRNNLKEYIEYCFNEDGPYDEGEAYYCLDDFESSQFYTYPSFERK